jgi:hypothetical protein
MRSTRGSWADKPLTTTQWSLHTTATLAANEAMANPLLLAEMSIEPQKRSDDYNFYCCQKAQGCGMRHATVIYSYVTVY